MPTMAERRKWLRKAKTEITRRKIQERVDEIAEAHGHNEWVIRSNIFLTHLHFAISSVLPS